MPCTCCVCSTLRHSFHHCYVIFGLACPGRVCAQSMNVCCDFVLPVCRCRVVMCMFASPVCWCIALVFVCMALCVTAHTSMRFSRGMTLPGPLPSPPPLDRPLQLAQHRVHRSCTPGCLPLRRHSPGVVAGGGGGAEGWLVVRVGEGPGFAGGWG